MVLWHIVNATKVVVTFDLLSVHTLSRVCLHTRLGWAWFSTSSGTFFSGSGVVVLSRPVFFCNTNRSFARPSSSSSLIQLLASINWLAKTSILSLCVGMRNHSFRSFAIRVVALVTYSPSHSTNCWQVLYCVIVVNACQLSTTMNVFQLLSVAETLALLTLPFST